MSETFKRTIKSYVVMIIYTQKPVYKLYVASRVQRKSVLHYDKKYRS